MQLPLPHLSALTLLRVTVHPGRISLPDVCCDVIWTGETLLLSGPMTTAAPMEGRAQQVAILRIEPGAARTWLGAPLRHVVDKVIALSDMDKRRADELLPLCETGRLALLTASHAPRQVETSEMRLAAAARALRDGAPVRAAAAAASWSERQLERQFAASFGVSPKVFARITRFRRAVLKAKHGAPLADAAALGGYVDQAHFSREARAFTGRSPGALLPNVGNIQDVVAGDL